jgi:hypothetical protein
MAHQHGLLGSQVSPSVIEAEGRELDVVTELDLTRGVVLVTPHPLLNGAPSSSLAAKRTRLESERTLEVPARPQGRPLAVLGKAGQVLALVEEMQVGADAGLERRSAPVARGQGDSFEEEMAATGVVLGQVPPEFERNLGGPGHDEKVHAVEPAALDLPHGEEVDPAEAALLEPAPEGLRASALRVEAGDADPELRRFGQLEALGLSRQGHEDE